MQKTSKKEFEDSIALFQYFEFDEKEQDAIHDEPTSIRSSLGGIMSFNRRDMGRSLNIPSTLQILDFQKVTSIKKNY